MPAHPLLSSWRRTYPTVARGLIEYFMASSEELVRNARLGVREPAPVGSAYEPEIIFVPCFLADHRGNRIGRGAGFFDAYLKRRPEVFAVGVVHSDYVLKEIPAGWLHAGDQKLSALITDTYLLKILKDGER